MAKVKESKEAKYRDTLSKLVPFVNENIDKSPNKIVITTVESIIHSMGSIFKKDISIYKSNDDINIRALFELKYLLWPDGIVVDGALTNKGDGLIFRRATSEDRSPNPGLTTDIGEEDIYYLKRVDAAVVTGDISSISDNDIENIIDGLNALIGDSVMSVTKIGDWEKVKTKEDNYYIKNIVVDVETQNPFTIPDKNIRSDIDSLNIADAAISVDKIGDYEKAKFK